MGNGHSFPDVSIVQSGVGSGRGSIRGTFTGPRSPLQ
jgi:hypothetical protein